MRGKISRLFAASMVPVSASGNLAPPPAVRLEPPALTAPEETTKPLVLGPETLTYTSTGTPLRAPLGTMQLSSNFASFELYKGHMTLESVGALPNYPGYRIATEFLAGASVYRVTNAEQYFLDNPTICGGKPPKFVVAKVISLADIQDGSTTAVNLRLLSMDNYGDFRPTTVDPCGGDTYKAAKISRP